MTPTKNNEAIAEESSLSDDSQLQSSSLLNKLAKNEPLDEPELPRDFAEPVLVDDSAGFSFEPDDF